MLINWSVNPEIFSIGPVHVRWYGVMFLIGFSLSFHFMREAFLKEGKPVEKLESLLIHIVAGTVIGARLGHVLFYEPARYLADPLSILKVHEGGLASHGGGIGVILAIVLYARKNPEFSVWWLVDRSAILTIMTGAFIRIGNLMNSEILGKPTDGTWGLIFTHRDSIPRHPAVVYESICYALVFGVTYFLYRRWRERAPDGLLFGLVVGSIMICRFGIEYFKEPQAHFEQGMALDMGQLLSLPFILVSVFLIYRGVRRFRAKTISTR